MLPAEAMKVVPFDSRSDVGALRAGAFLGQEWERGFATLTALDQNLDYLEARLVDILRPIDALPTIVANHPESKGASPFTQRLSTLIDRLEEQVVRVETLQRRLDV